MKIFHLDKMVDELLDQPMMRLNLFDLDGDFTFLKN